MSLSRPTRSSAAFTADFREDFEAETARLLRARFLWFTRVVAAVWCIEVVLRLVAHFLTASDPGDLAAWRGSLENLALALPTLVLCAALYRRELTRPRPKSELVTMTFWLVVLDGLSRVAGRELALAGAGGLWGVVLTHVVAALLIPWTARQAVAPVAVVLAVNAALLLGGFFFWGPRTDSFDSRLAQLLISTLFSPFAALPGVLISFTRHSRRVQNFRVRVLQRRYGEIRQELVDARRIHEALFPAPVSSGPLRFSYRYEPMRLIGGDYLYAAFTPRSHHAPAPADAALSIVVMDVTGHGIAAALTVNRLHGEIERVFAENPAASPGDVLALLNRYVHLTLATHSVYVTALCLRFDPARAALEYASGGHPPAFLRAVDGTIEQLPSTAFVLGACAAADFHPDPRSLRFGPGDTLIAYTDGAIESRDARGRMLGVAGVQRIIASASSSPDAGWPELILRAAAAHRGRPADDDTLVIEVSRPLTDAPSPHAPLPAHAPPPPRRSR